VDDGWWVAEAYQDEVCQEPVRSAVTVQEGVNPLDMRVAPGDRLSNR
jgi:hypothetical protein